MGKLPLVRLFDTDNALTTEPVKIILSDLPTWKRSSLSTPYFMLHNPLISRFTPDRFKVRTEVFPRDDVVYL